MIYIDPKTQAIAGNTRLGKAKNKKRDVKFSKTSKNTEANSKDRTNNVADISGMLFLQEINQRAEDERNLEEFSKSAFKALKQLQLDLLAGKVEINHLHNLKTVVEKGNFALESPELKQIAEEIQLRLEVEIAKLEVGQKSKSI